MGRCIEILRKRSERKEPFKRIFTNILEKALYRYIQGKIDQMHTKKKLLAADCEAIIENINEKDENELTRTVQNNFFLTKMIIFYTKK